MKSEKDTENEHVSVPEELEDILLEFTINVLVEKPDDIIDYAASYFTRMKSERHGVASTLGISQPTDDPSSHRIKDGINKILGARGRRRTSVLGEVIDPEIDNIAEIEVYAKSKEEKERIRSRTKDIFLFKHLNSENLEAIIDAMRPTKVKEGQVIIRQGEEGDFFYVVDKGIFDTFITDSDGREQFIKSYEDSGSFGELALLHNQPRAATIKAATDGILWAVSRNTFTKLVVKSAFEKRKKYMELLDKVPELQSLTEYEKMQVCDALSSVTINEGEVLFEEGDEGNGMYFIEEGNIKIEKGTSGEELAKLGAGEYFGEMALVKKQPRAGTAKALEKTSLAFLDVAAFERLLGPCMEIMKKRVEAYETKKK